MDEGTSQAHKMFVRDEDDFTTHEKAFIKIVHPYLNMESIMCNIKLLMLFYLKVS